MDVFTGCDRNRQKASSLDKDDEGKETMKERREWKRQRLREKFSTFQIGVCISLDFSQEVIRCGENLKKLSSLNSICGVFVVLAVLLRV